MEILIVFTIISILAMIGTPFYQNYKLKTKVGVSIAGIAPVKSLATEYFVFNSSWPQNNAEAGGKAPEAYAANYLTSVALSDSPVPGSIVLTYDNSALRTLGNKNTLIYYPEQNNSESVVWKCDRGTLEDRYRPANCRA